MKALSFVLFFSFLTLASAAPAPTTVTVGLKQAYVPVGFDDNDRIQIAVSGVFRNTCFKMGPHALKVDTVKKEIRIQQQAYYYSGVCLQMFVPFNEIVDIGIVPPATYKLIDASSGTGLGSLEVKSSGNQPGPDDFLYAPVSDAYVVNNPESGKRLLALTGNFGDRCSDFSEIKINSIEEMKKTGVMVVQPVIARNEEADCSHAKVRFLKTVELDANIPTGVYLLHVRSLNGQAVNKIVDLD